MNDQQRLKFVADLSEQAARVWHSQNRELLASFPPDVFKAMSSWIRLYEKETIQTSEPNLQTYISILDRAFTTVWDREAINNIAPITLLGNRDLERMRRSTGIGVSALPAPAPAPLSAEQRLEAEVLSDWHNLPSAKIKAKANANKAYKAMFEKLSATDAINSQVTLLSRIEGIGG